MVFKEWSKIRKKELEAAKNIFKKKERTEKGLEMKEKSKCYRKNQEWWKMKLKT